MWQKFEVFCNEKNRRKIFFRFLILNSINVEPLNKVVGPGKNPKLINVGPTYL
jgi:hypothetical protein